MLPRWGARIGHGVLGGAVAVAVPVLVYRACGLNILDILPLTARACRGMNVGPLSRRPRLCR